MMRKQLISVILICAPLAAGLAWDIPLEWVVAHSDTIVQGWVTDVRVEKSGKDFFSIYSIAVERTLLGKASDQVTLRLFGGEIPGEGGCWYSDRPVIRKGEHIIIMLRHDTDHPVAGDNRGKFTIMPDGRIRENGMTVASFLDLIRRVRG